jgi:hypothetical protein
MAQKNTDKMTERGRDAKTGEFIPKEKAEKRPDKTTVEKVKSTGGQNSTERGKDGKFKK